MLAGKAEDRDFNIRWYVTPKGNTKTSTWLVRGNRLCEGVTMDQYNKYRTKGEQPEMLRDILKDARYKESEVTLKDNLISPYIGKVYDDATEVLSRGLESIFELVKIGQLKYVDNNGQAHKSRIEDDEEYLNLILGILLKG